MKAAVTHLKSGRANARFSQAALLTSVDRRRARGIARQRAAAAAAVARARARKLK